MSKLAARQPSAQEPESSEVAELIERYFDLLHTNDLALFDQVFDQRAHLYGLRDGAPLVWPAATYREVLAQRRSPRSQGAVREEEILSSDRASATLAFVKLKVRVGEAVFIDYLTMLDLSQGWRVVSKTYHRLAN